MRRGALGIIEINGFVNLSFILDQMIKSADVELIKYEHVGSGMVSAVVWGDLASVKHAVEIGATEARAEGIALSHCILAKLRSGTLRFLLDREVD